MIVAYLAGLFTLPILAYLIVLLIWAWDSRIRQQWVYIARHRTGDKLPARRTFWLEGKNRNILGVHLRRCGIWALVRLPFTVPK